VTPGRVASVDTGAHAAHSKFRQEYGDVAKLAGGHAHDTGTTRERIPDPGADALRALASVARRPVLEPYDRRVSWNRRRRVHGLECPATRNATTVHGGVLLASSRPLTRSDISGKCRAGRNFF
jgi:hypothetical protein